MLKIDYEQFILKHNYLINLDVQAYNLLSNCFDEFGQVGTDLQEETPDHELSNSCLIDFIVRASKSGQIFTLSSASEVSLDDYLLLYAHITTKKFPDELSFRELSSRARSITFKNAKHSDRPLIDFYLLSTYIRNHHTPWKDVIRGFSAEDWSEIDLLSAVLPLSAANLQDVKPWLIQIVQRHEADGALHYVGVALKNWIVYSKDAAEEVWNSLSEMASDEWLSRFIGGAIKGLHRKEGRTIYDLAPQVLPHITKNTSYYVLFFIGSYGIAAEKDKQYHYKLLTDTHAADMISAGEYLQICSIYQYFYERTYQIADEYLEAADHAAVPRVIIHLVENASEKADLEWIRRTIFKLVAFVGEDENNPFEGLLSDIANRDLDLAYELIEHRMKAIRGKSVLRAAMGQVAAKDVSRMQTKIIVWFNSEDADYHRGMLQLCTTNVLPIEVFMIPGSVFEKLQNSDKLYIAYKVAGYVYSMEALQHLLISIAKSVEQEDDTLFAGLHYIFSEYVIYNYRSTLKLLKKELESSGLSFFAKTLFERLIAEYDEYFEALKQIGAPKELKPYDSQIQLYRFYFKSKHSQEKVSTKSFAERYLTSSYVNSNRWAVRRDGELKHVVSPLAHIEYSMEFPSGEKLNPIYQEFIRRSYQQLTKNEINPD